VAFSSFLKIFLPSRKDNIDTATQT